MADYNLAVPPTPFVGRTHELSEVLSRLADPDCHLLTLVGPGGVGKTRLALETARRSVEGVCFVSLQSLTSAELVVPAIAEALNFTFRGEGDSRQQLVEFLRGKHLLLILDNFEQVMTGADLLPEIVAQAPYLKVLVTSRETLRLREEWVMSLSGLDFPLTADQAGWQGFDAVQLFLQSARRAGYTLADADIPAIVHICQMVEGIPLAVELAAAWVRIMSCADIAREVARSFDILMTNTHNMPEKHRSMRVVFEHSWMLLDGAEQAVFCRLSVFRGGFTREGAEQVAGATLAVLASLVDKSLVLLNANGRYDLHELLRQYAAEKLQALGEADFIDQQHTRYYLQLAEGAEAHAFGGEQVAWFDLMQVEFSNLRLALNRSIASASGLQMATALGWFFSERGIWNEGLMWMERALTANPNAPALLRAKAYHTAGALAGFVGKISLVQTYCDRALALARANDDRWNAAWALSHLAVFVWGDQANDQIDESIKLFRELNDLMGLSHSLVRRSWFARRAGDHEGVRRFLEEAALYARSAGDKVVLAWASFELGKLSWNQDYDMESARTHFLTSLTLFGEARVHVGVDNALLSLAQVELLLGNLKQAQVYGEKALRQLWNATPETGFLSASLHVLADIARARGQLERAVTLLGAVHSGIWHDTKVFGTEISFKDDETGIWAELGEAAFNRAWAAGQVMTREQAVTYALEEAALPAAASIDQSQPDSLSSRELEVLALIADGLSNHEIANLLVIEVSTVKKHVEHIFDKLYTKNRTSAVARARELNLLP